MFKLVSFLLLFIIAIACIAASPLNVWAQTTSLSPTASYFISDATNNGYRRFLAVGNFYDVTNNAHFTNSTAILRFQQGQLPVGAKLKSINLITYKYANAYTSTVNINLRLNGEIIGTLGADSGDYDYDILQFDLTAKLSKLMGQPVEMRLTVDTPQWSEGIALCSGNIIDNICPVQYHPRLVYDYEPNTIGRVEKVEHSPKILLKAGDQDNYASCVAKKGCQLSYKFFISDQEKNIAIVLFHKDSTGIVSYHSFHTGITSQSMYLADGNYQRWYEVKDGDFFQKVDLPAIRIVTNMPKQVSMYLDTPRLSPANKDNLYDDLQIKFAEQVKASTVRVTLNNGKVGLVREVIINKDGRSLTLQGKNLIYLASGKYKLTAEAYDTDGYSILRKQDLNLTIDNIAPKLYN